MSAIRSVLPVESEPKEEYVLVVDDDADAREIFTRVIEHKGFKVQSVDSGLAALAQARQQKPALILLDLMMPGMNGFQTIGRLRSSQETRDIPIIVLSAAADARMLQLPGVVRVFRKADFEIADLGAAIQDILGSQRPMSG